MLRSSLGCLQQVGQSKESCHHKTPSPASVSLISHRREEAMLALWTGVDWPSHIPFDWPFAFSRSQNGLLHAAFGSQSTTRPRCSRPADPGPGPAGRRRGALAFQTLEEMVAWQRRDQKGSLSKRNGLPFPSDGVYCYLRACPRPLAEKSLSKH